MRMLVAVDLSADAGETVIAAGGWAARLRAVVDLVYVDALGLVADRLRDQTLREMVLHEWDGQRVGFRTQLDMLLLKVPAKLRGAPLVTVGQPVEVIVRMAREYDLVAVGTEGRTGVRRWVVGSVAEAVVRRSPKPVLVLRSGEEAQTGV